MNKTVSVLFASDLPTGSTTRELYNAFKKINNVEIDYLIKKNENLWSVKPSFIHRVFNKIRLPLDLKNINKLILKEIETGYDYIFFIKSVKVYPSTLKKIKKMHPKTKIIFWSQDDMYAWHNRSIYFTLGIKHYDLVITQKSYNVDELKSLGAQSVLFQNKAYSSELYYKHDCHGSKFNYDVLFVGAFEQARYESMLFLAENGIRVDIYGPGWKKYIQQNKNMMIHDQLLIGEDYVAALSCAKISLCFLRKVNRDLQTSRTMEIPACGGFMIAERTNEHLELFEEDKEAVFYESDEELMGKVNYYLEHSQERKKIANAGFERTEIVS